MFVFLCLWTHISCDPDIDSNNTFFSNRNMTKDNRIGIDNDTIL